MRTIPVLSVAALLALAACGGSSNNAADTAGEPTNAAPVTAAATTTTLAPASTLPATTTTTIDELARNQAVNRYIDAAALNAACTSFDCLGAQETYDRYTNLWRLSIDIPGADMIPFQDAITIAVDDWNVCFETAVDRFDCGDEEDQVALVIDDLYDALR